MSILYSAPSSSFHSLLLAPLQLLDLGSSILSSPSSSKSTFQSCFFLLFVYLSLVRVSFFAWYVKVADRWPKICYKDFIAHFTTLSPLSLSSTGVLSVPSVVGMFPETLFPWWFRSFLIAFSWILSLDWKDPFNMFFVSLGNRKNVCCGYVWKIDWIGQNRCHILSDSCRWGAISSLSTFATLFVLVGALFKVKSIFFLTCLVHTIWIFEIPFFLSKL